MAALPIPFPGVPEDEPLEPIPPVNYMDWRLSHGRLWIDNQGGEGSPSDWSHLLKRKGEAAMEVAYRELCAKTVKKLFFNNFIEYFTAKDEAAQARDRKAIESLLRTPSAASDKLADMAALEGVSDKVAAIAQWALDRPAILERLRKARLI